MKVILILFLVGRLSSLSAVRLLCRYCNTLNQDRFTSITPIWILEKVTMRPSLEEFNLITVIMPLDCPVKEEIKVGFLR